MPQRQSRSRFGALCASLPLAIGAAVQAAAPAPPVDSANASNSTSPLEKWQQAQNQLRTEVWRLYDASASVGADARGRRIAQDLADWVMADEVRTRLEQIGAQASEQYRMGDSTAAQATLVSGRETYIDQSRRLSLIILYWGQKLLLERQQALWRSWLPQVPAPEAERSRAVLRPLEERLAHDFSPTATSETLTADVDALKQAYNAERIKLAGQVSEQREAAGRSMGGRDRTIPCQEAEGDEPNRATDSGGGPQDHGIQVISSPSMEQFYPHNAREAEITGRVFLRLSVGTSGCVEHVEVVSSSGAPELDEAAMDLAEYYRLRPAQKGGRPVASRTGLPVKFTLSDDDATTQTAAPAHVLSADELSTLMRRAQADFFAGKQEQALAESADAVRSQPAAFPMYALRARIYRIRGELDKSIDEARAATFANQHDARAYVVAGQIFAASHQEAEASGAFDQAVQLAQDESAYLTRAAFRPSTDRAGKQSDLEEAIKRNPKSITALVMLAELESGAHAFDDALATLNRAIAINGKTTYDLLTRRGVIYAKNHQNDLAEQDFEAARALVDPAVNPIWLNNMCWQMATNDVALATALSFCDTADAHAPESYAILDSRAFVLLRLKRYSESINTYDDALKVYPSGESSLYGRGLAKRASGQSDAGDVDIRAALAIDGTVAKRFAGFGLSP